MGYWEACKPTYMESWPDSLHSLSIASTDIPLTWKDGERLIANMMDYADADLRIHEPDADFSIDGIRERVASAVSSYPPAGTFVRLGSRSPKDSWSGHDSGFCTKVGDDPLRFILDASERMYEDLTLAIHQKYDPHIWVRQWIDIQPWQEFRCFMRGRELVGISQYNYLQSQVEQTILDDRDAIDWAIRDLFFPTFRDASHLDDVVFDAVVNCKYHGSNTREWSVKLLEINPFFNMTDPCLFSWRSGFDGSFRYNENI